MRPRFLFAAAILVCATALSAADPVTLVVEHAISHPRGGENCTFDHSVYTGERAALPIGVFDSGIGGLTVLEQLLRTDVFDNRTLQPGVDGVRDFGTERFVYLGDQANMPYGNYPSAGRTDLLRELILRDAVFLLQQKAKAIVIACNTATAFGLEDIRTALTAWKISVPVVGVVEAGARGVMEALPREGKGDAIAVLATVGTCSCEAYPKAIGRAVGLAGKSLPAVVQQGCVGLAGAIEGDPAFVCLSGERTAPYAGPKPETALRGVYGFDESAMNGDELNSVANHVRYEVTSLMERHRRSGSHEPVGMVVLGCTHYPLVQGEIAKAFAHLRDYTDETGAQPYAALIRETLVFINPAEYTARELFLELARARVRQTAMDDASGPKHAFFLTVPNPDWPGVSLTPAGALDVAYKHGRPLGDFSRRDVRTASMTPDLLSLSAREAIRQLMPEVWSWLK